MPQSRKRRLERLEYDPLDPAKQHKVASAGEIVSTYVDGHILAGATATNRALATWRRVAGKRAVKHTVAVWLSEPMGPRNLPELVVYLDGNALMADLTTNAELYVDLLAHAGLEVSRVRFKLSKKAGQRRAPTGDGREGPRAAAELPPLTAYERARVELATSGLPPKIRENASKAMEMSMRRAKLETTRDNKMGPQNPRQ